MTRCYICDFDEVADSLSNPKDTTKQVINNIFLDKDTGKHICQVCFDIAHQSAIEGFFSDE